MGRAMAARRIELRCLGKHAHFIAESRINPRHRSLAELICAIWCRLCHARWLRDLEAAEAAVQRRP